MKKPTRFIAGLALSALVLTGCAKDLKADKNGNIVTVTIDGNPVKIQITAGGMFDDYLQTATGLKDYYDAVYQAVVRVLFERENQKTERTEIYDYASRKTEEVKEDAKNNAKNGGKYKDELETLLKSYDVETLEELKEKFAYEKMQEKLKTQFFDGGDGAWIQNAMTELRDGERDAAGDLVLDTNGNPTYEGYLNNKLPYHVRHLLVKVSAASNDFVSGTITSSEANRLSSVIQALTTIEKGSVSFGQLANRFSEDEGSRQVFGDLGIMSTSTSYVNEFKLGVYAYDAIFDTEKSATEKAKLNIPTDVKTSLENIGLGEVPYEAVLKLQEVRNEEKTSGGKEVMDGEERYFPRNIIFNKYFNKHNISLITPNKINVEDEVGTPDAGYAALKGFNAVPELGGKTYLTDENGNPILMVRAGSSGSYEGIHFIVVERSALDPVVNGVSLSDYYTIETPGTAAFPKDTSGNDLDVFVNFLKLDTTGTKGRVDTVKNEIKQFDPNINDRIFNKLVDELNVEFHNKDLQSALEVYLENQYAASLYTQDNTLVKDWNEWAQFLEYQEYQRSTRLVDESYIDIFRTSGADFDWSSK